MTPKDNRVINTPSGFSGMWIAWDANHTTVIASGETMREAKEKAKKQTDKYWLDKIPPENQLFNGISDIQ